MVSRLKGHLDAVLQMQEQVGKMHLSLEGLGPLRHPSDSSTDTSKGKDERSEETLHQRELGVEEIMSKVSEMRVSFVVEPPTNDQLGDLSSQLRSYHSVGTPKLSFPRAGV